MRLLTRQVLPLVGLVLGPGLSCIGRNTDGILVPSPLSSHLLPSSPLLRLSHSSPRLSLPPAPPPPLPSPPAPFVCFPLPSLFSESTHAPRATCIRGLGGQTPRSQDCLTRRIGRSSAHRFSSAQAAVKTWVHPSSPSFLSLPPPPPSSTLPSFSSLPPSSLPRAPPARPPARAPKCRAAC